MDLLQEAFTADYETEGYDRQLWEVVGGGDKGGVVVRMKKEVNSKELPRLAKGSWVEEMELVGDRLHYKKVSGDGPDFGWVSTTFKGATLLMKRDGPPPSSSGAPTKASPVGSPADSGASPSQPVNGKPEPPPPEANGHNAEEDVAAAAEAEAARRQEEMQKQVAIFQDVGNILHMLNPGWGIDILVNVAKIFQGAGVRGHGEMNLFVMANHLGLRLQVIGLEGLRENCLIWRELMFRIIFTDCASPPPLHFSPLLMVMYVLKMFAPAWSVDMLFFVQGVLERRLGVVGPGELLQLAYAGDLSEQLEQSGLGEAKDVLLKYRAQVAPTGFDKWLGLDTPVRPTHNVSGKWVLKRPGQEEQVFSFQFNQTPGSGDFRGPGVSIGSIRGDLVEWKVHFHGCSGCMGVLKGEEMVNVLLIAETGHVLDEYVGHREAGSQERMTVTPLASNDSEADMLKNPCLPSVPLVTGKVAVVRTAPHLGDRASLLTSLDLTTATDDRENVCTLILDPSVRCQTHLGFGGSFTESAADLILKLDSVSQDQIIDAYFSKEAGLGYELCRLHTTSCDFSTGNWTCCEEEGDLELSSFSLKRYESAILPMIRRAVTAAGAPLKLVGSPWSPPPSMKEPQSMVNGAKLKPECAEAWARYYVRFAKEMEEAGLPLWAMTVQNEPGGKMRWESCTYSHAEERDFVRDHLGPSVESSELDVKLIVWDHNRDEMFERAQTVYGDPAAADYVWGVGFHWYGDPRFETWPPLSQVCFDNVARVHELRPEKHLIMTEACQENGPHLGEWRIAERYAMNIIEDLNRWTEGWIDWNLILDERGGPNHADNYCSAPIIVDAARDAVFFLPSFYYIAHFSRYIRPGAQRVLCASDRDVLRATAYVNPDGTLVVVVLNEDDLWVDLSIKLTGEAVHTAAPAHSITTFVFPFQAASAASLAEESAGEP